MNGKQGDSNPEYTQLNLIDDRYLDYSSELFSRMFIKEVFK